tara:strand:+ start:758 stop:1213 length:456 start_codon:yes stop_codon:yes gene_type:complete
MKATNTLLKNLILNRELKSVMDELKFVQRENLVTITGRFKSEEDKQKVLLMLGQIPGLNILCDVMVDDEMIVSENDLVLKTTVLKALKAGIKYYNQIVVKVSAGRVFLDGKVANENDRCIAFSLVDQIHGVKSIINNLTFSRLNKSAVSMA